MVEIKRKKKSKTRRQNGQSVLLPQRTEVDVLERAMKYDKIQIKLYISQAIQL